MRYSSHERWHQAFSVNGCGWFGLRLDPGVMEGFGGWLVALGEVQGDLVDTGSKRRGAQDVGVGAPTENPPLHFFEATQAHLQLRAAAGEFLHGLGRMTNAWCSLLRPRFLSFDIGLLRDDFKNHRLSFSYERPLIGRQCS